MSKIKKNLEFMGKPLEGFLAIPDYKVKALSLSKQVEKLPFKVNFINTADPVNSVFVEQLIALNVKAFGEMGVPPWVLANFGTIGAGICGGLIWKGKPVSMWDFVGITGQSQAVHDWTLLVDPDLENSGLGTITFAFQLHIAGAIAKYFQFIAQTDNKALNLYLKNIYSLEIKSYGFCHTKPNSMLLVTQIPENAYQAIVQGKAFKPNVSQFFKTETMIKQGDLDWQKGLVVPANAHQVFLAINEKIVKGEKFKLAGINTVNKEQHLLIKK
ncbi:hypothetical protein ISS86_02775 [Candidatus Microgenomates bacterium]|nr:hypothetical protein [Candidatus Microgenomates bacterium]